MEWRCKRVDGRRSSALGGRGRGADGRARSMSVVVPGTGLLRRPGLDPDLGLMDASVPDCCSQPRVQRAATRSPSAVAVGVGEKGALCHTRQIEGAKTESPSSKRGSSAGQHVLPRGGGDGDGG